MAALDMRPLSLAEMLAREPAGVADRWHGRLYLLRPALRISLGLFRLWTGIATAFFFPRAEGEALLAAVGVPASLFGPAYSFGCLLNVVLGLACWPAPRCDWSRACKSPSPSPTWPC